MYICIRRNVINIKTVLLNYRKDSFGLVNNFESERMPEAYNTRNKDFILALCFHFSNKVTLGLQPGYFEITVLVNRQIADIIFRLITKYG